MWACIFLTSLDFNNYIVQNTLPRISRFGKHMLEAYEYFDMARRCQRVVSLAVGSMDASFQAEMKTFPQFSRRKLKPGRSDITGEEKRRAMKEHPDWFEFDQESTCPGWEALPFTTCEMTMASIGAYGKHLCIIVSPTWFLRVTLFQHGQVVSMSRKQLKCIQDEWLIDQPKAPHVHILFAVDPTDERIDFVIAVIDHTKCAQIEVVKSLEFTEPWTNEWINSGKSKSRVGPCAIREPESFRELLDKPKPFRSTYKAMIGPMLTRDNEHFNGVGASHRCEILHKALLHPATPMMPLFQNEDSRKGFLDAYDSFFEGARNPKSEYQKRVPADTTGGSAFWHPAGVTKYINESFHRVYRKTRNGLLLSNDIYDDLVRRGQLDPVSLLSSEKSTKNTSKTRVPVYCYKIGNGTGGGYYYSIIYRIPDGAQECRRLTRDEALKHALGTRNEAEIGITSFRDTLPLQKRERSKSKQFAGIRKVAVPRRGRGRQRRTFTIRKRMLWHSDSKKSKWSTPPTLRRITSPIQHKAKSLPSLCSSINTVVPGQSKQGQAIVNEA